MIITVVLHLRLFGFPGFPASWIIVCIPGRRDIVAVRFFQRPFLPLHVTIQEECVRSTVMTRRHAPWGCAEIAAFHNCSRSDIFGSAVNDHYQGIGHSNGW